MNEAVFRIEADDRVVVTGATGFIGSAVVRALVARGVRPVALVEPGANRQSLDGLRVTQLECDVTDDGALRAALDGARFCFHLAALYGFWPRDAQRFYRVNVEGTRHVINAALAAGVARVCYTSSVATLGLTRTDRGELANESDFAHVDHLFGTYKQTKYVAEHEVLRMAAEGAPVVLVLPTMPQGPYDRRPTPSGKVVLDYLNGKIPGFVNTRLNVAHVDDLAEGHLLALEFGTQGRSYICGGENLSMRELLAHLAGVTALPAADRSFPAALPLVASWLSEFVEGIVLRREPRVPREAALMSTTAMVFDDARARRELGYVSRPAVDALYDAARWFVANGYVTAPRAARIAWRPPTGATTQS